MRKGGLGYASAVAMEEATLLDFNPPSAANLPKLVAIYPKEGTFFSDSPFIVLDGDWVTPEQREGAQAFQQFLAKEITPEVAARGGFRPADLEAEPVAPITPANGVDPKQPERVLGAARAARAGAAQAHLARGPQARQRAAGARHVRLDGRRVRGWRTPSRASTSFLSQVAPQDRVGLTTFSDRDHAARARRPVPREQGEAAGDGHAA